MLFSTLWQMLISDNGLSPVRCQVIFCNYGLLSVELLGANKLGEFSIKLTKKILTQENESENVAWKMVTILSSPQCINLEVKGTHCFEGLAQDCSNSTAITLELLQSCAEPWVSCCEDLVTCKCQLWAELVQEVGWWGFCEWFYKFMATTDKVQLGSRTCSHWLTHWGLHEMVSISQMTFWKWFSFMKTEIDFLYGAFDSNFFEICLTSPNVNKSLSVLVQVLVWPRTGDKPLS